jgi:hypothetical protein
VHQRLFVLGVAVAAAGGALLALWPAPEPPEFVSKEHKFRVRFGSEPEVTTSAGAVTRTSAYSVESPEGRFAVTVTDVPVPDDDPPGRAPIYLNSAKDDLIRAAGGEQVSTSSIALAGKYPGREFTARFRHPSPGVMHARIYLVGKRLYQVLVKGTEEFANAPAATAFLDSFMVTE